MPELPEVEVTRRSFVDRIASARILALHMGKPLRWPLGVPALRLVGRQVVGVRRRGKYLLLDLDQGLLLLHLGMSGSLNFAPAQPEPGVHDHMDLVTDRGVLRLHDPRRFGAVVWAPSEHSAPAQKLLGHLGVEPLNGQFEVAAFGQALKKRQSAIKQVLLAGDVVVGVGNIYASEALFFAGIRPTLRADRLSGPRAARLHGAVARVPDDHHEVATFLAIGGVTGGRLTVETDMGPHMTLILRQLGKLGLQFEQTPGSVTVTGWTRRIAEPYTAEMLPKIEAAPWPYFPADLLPHAVGIAVGCEGDIMFWNKVYEGALGWSAELLKFGARVHLSDPHRLIVFGGNPLRPATVEAPYIIRVVVALLLAAIQVPGESRIKNADPIRRAYPHFVEKLTALDARVRWE